MSTRSMIAHRIPEAGRECYRTIYCHWDGHPSHNGKLLMDHYSDTAKLTELLNLGDISSLAPEIGEQKPFTPPSHDIRSEEWKNHAATVTSYKRDRGEPNCDARTYSLFDLVQAAKGCGAEYIYVWDGSEWEWFSTDAGLAMIGMPSYPKGQQVSV